MKLQNEPKHNQKMPRKKKAAEFKSNSRKASKNSLIEGNILIYLLVDYSLGKSFMEETSMKMTDQSTDERTNKKEKRFPEQIPSTNKAFVLNLACNEKFE